MELQHIKDNVYYLRYAINMGVVVGEEGQAILIDSGLGDRSGRRILRALEAEGLRADCPALFHATLSGGCHRHGGRADGRQCDRRSGGPAGHTGTHTGYIASGVFFLGDALCTYHASLRQPLYLIQNGWTQRRWVQRTPAMAAGLTDHRWIVLELLSYRVPPLLQSTPLAGRGHQSDAIKCDLTTASVRGQKGSAN